MARVLMDLQDIFVHVLLEVQDFVVKVRNYVNIFSESFLNVTVSTKDQEMAFQDEKNNFGKVQPKNIFISLFCAGNRNCRETLKLIKIYFLQCYFHYDSLNLFSNSRKTSLVQRRSRQQQVGFVCLVETDSVRSSVTEFLDG